MRHADADDITSGSIPWVLTILAAPLVVQNLVHVANAIIDTFWLGRLGEPEVAAVGLNFPVISIVAAAVVLVSLGTQITLAQRVGADEPGTARRIAGTGLVLALAVGVTVCGGIALGAERLMATLAGEPVVARLATIYLVTLMAFYPLAFLSDTVENAFIGWGDTAVAMYINLGMVGTNVVLDPVLIFGVGPLPALGVRGAAIASGLGLLAGLGIGIAFAVGARDTFRLTRSALRPRLDLAKQVLAVGGPLAGQRIARDVVRVMIIGLVAVTAGAAGVAAFTVGARVATLAFVPAIGLQQAAQAMVGQNLGADRPARALRTTVVGVTMATIGLGLLGAGQWVFPELIVDILVPQLTDRGRRLSVLYLRILALSYWALGATYLLLAGYNGARHTRTSFVVDLLKYWGVRLPIAVLAIPTTVMVSVIWPLRPGLGLGVEAIFWAVTVSNIVTVPALGAYFLYKTRSGMFERAAAAARAETS